MTIATVVTHNYVITIYTLQIYLLCNHKRTSYLISQHLPWHDSASGPLSVQCVRVLAVPAWLRTDMQVPLSEQSPLQCKEAEPRHSPSDRGDEPQLHSSLDGRMRFDRWMDGK